MKLKLPLLGILTLIAFKLSAQTTVSFIRFECNGIAATKEPIYEYSFKRIQDFKTDELFMNIRHKPIWQLERTYSSLFQAVASQQVK